MVRTKQAANKGKSKAKERGSSSQQEPPSQRQRTEEEHVRGPKPGWGGGPLSGMDPDWQFELFKDKMKKLQVRSEGFLCERRVDRHHFAPYGIVKYFEDVGWEAVMGFDEMEVNKLYMDPIEEWVGTLQIEMNSQRPGSMRLIGTVGGVEVVMSRENLNHIARFDTKASNQYVFPKYDDLYGHPERHPTWNRMVESIFEPGKGMRMLRNDLRIEAKLLLVFLHNNVMPRRGDKVSVRHSEVPILYSLMNGVPKISFRYLAMMNIWEARNNKEKKLIPHCKLIQALIRWYGLLDDEDYVFMKKHHVPFRLDKLSKQAWRYSQSDRYHRLVDVATDRVWDVVKTNARPLMPGEYDGFVQQQGVPDVEMGGASGSDDDDDDIPIARMIGRSRGEGSSQGPRFQEDRGTAWGDNDEAMERVITRARPQVWRDWPPYARVLFDQGTRNSELQRRETQMAYDRNEHWNRLHAYNFQREINHNFDDAQQRRMHDEWHRGEPVVQHPPVIDYASLDPYDGSVRYPQPQTHHSEWVHPYQDQQQQQGQGSSSAGVFDFGAIEETMTSIFGPQQPRYF